MHGQSGSDQDCLCIFLCKIPVLYLGEYYAKLDLRQNRQQTFHEF